MFRVVKLGRARKLADEEILNRVSALLSSEYSYSVQGDLYMQEAWRGLKARLPGLEPPEVPGSPAAGREEKTARPTRRRSASGKPRARRSDAGKLSAGKAAASPRTQGNRTDRAGSPPAPVLNPRGSVSDRIKLLSGRRYDVYREEFLTRSGPAIRTWLAGRRQGARDVFEDTLGRAEDLIREFLEKNYSNPFMDWENSEARRRVESLGFSAPDLDGMIALWYEGRGR